MSFKLIATDLDGTLFYPKKRFKMICKKNINFLRSRIDKGDKVIIVSGRNYEYGKKVQKIIGRNLEFVNCNGAYIQANNDVIQNKGLGECICQIFEEIKKRFKFSASMIMSENYSLLINPGTSSSLYKFILSFVYSFQGIYAEEFLFVDDIAEQEELKNGKVYKLMLCFGFSAKAKRTSMEVQKFLDENYPEVESAYTNGFLEITPRDCLKSEGLKKILDYYKASPDQLYVIGDSGNDISMFDSFYHNSYCMAHAPEHVRCHAKHTIKRVHALEKYLD